MDTPHPPDPQAAAAQAPTGSPRGLLAVFGSTFFGLVGYFILSPLLLLRLKGADLSSTVAGLFAACGWLGIFVMTPFASAVARALGRRRCMALSSGALLLCALLYAVTQTVALWFALNLLSGMALALRWVLSEALIAEFCPSDQRGRFVGLFQTMVSATFIIGPALLVWLGSDHPAALWAVVGFTGLGFLWTALIPRLPQAADTASARIGLHGLWHALRAHPIFMLAGFIGGFFETGVTSILPLYGLALGLDASGAAMLVSVSGAGGMALTIPAGMLADRHGDLSQGRHALMRASAALMLLATLAMPLVAGREWLAWAMVFVWGGAGGTLYTMAMTDIGAREKGMTLLNSTSVLVLTYTLGGLLASGLCGALIDRSPTRAFPAVLLLVAGTGWLVLWRGRHRTAL